MNATITLTRKTGLELLIESNDEVAINGMIEQKEIALEDALKNAEYYKSINSAEFADNEQTRASLLKRQLKSLRAAI